MADYANTDHVKGQRIVRTQVGDAACGVTQFCCADYDIRLFEGQYPVNGMTYNSYVIEDEQLVVLDTVDHSVAELWLDALGAYLAGQERTPDFLIVQHLEPDHSACIGKFLAKYPDCKVCISAVGARMLPNFVPGIAPDRVVTVKAGDQLNIGSRSLRIVNGAMIHWPEVVMTYDPKSKVFFCADAFGTFNCAEAIGIAEGTLDTATLENTWLPEAMRYVINICGKYTTQVSALLEAASKLDISYLAPLHGPVIDLAKFNPIPAYSTWSSLKPLYPAKVFIPVATLHGNTLSAAGELSAMLEQRGISSTVLRLTSQNLSNAVADCFLYGTTVMMSSSYDASIMPYMSDLLSRLKSKGWRDRNVAVVENGSWAPCAGALIIKALADFKDMNVIEPKVTIRTQLNEESRADLALLADNIASLLKK